MVKWISGLVLAALIVILIPTSGQCDQKVPVNNEKLRVLVDKVLTRSSRELTEDQVKQIVEAGFNVISPRYAKVDSENVRNTAMICQKEGINYLPWMRGTLKATEGPKLVWANGVEQNICSPNSDELWKWFSDRIISFAKISAEVPSLMGVFLDFENYAPNKQSNAYPLSYDEKIIREFAEAKGIDFPQISTGQRFSWLSEKGLSDQFAQFQIESWRMRCKNLRKAVDAFNPEFQFVLYPTCTKFIQAAMYTELATKKAPIIIANATTYTRPSSLLNHEISLTSNKRFLTNFVKLLQQSKAPLLCLGGIDPLYESADPEFSGKNAVMIAEISDGYWIFYEGPRYGSADHNSYWQWFTKANQAIVKQNFQFWREDRETPDIVTRIPINCKTDKIQVAFYGLKQVMHDLVQKSGEFEVHKLGGISLDYLRQFKIVVLQNFNVSLSADSKISQDLRTYVEEGGRLFFTHDTIRFLDSPFPEIAKRCKPVNKYKAESEHVINSELIISHSLEQVKCSNVGVRFRSGFRDHMVFRSGPEGTVVVEDEHGNAVCVVGALGRGKVAFSGCLYGYRNRPIRGDEEQTFLAMINWLTISN